MTPTHFGGEIGYVAPGFVRLYQTSTLSPGVRRLSSALKRVVQTVGVSLFLIAAASRAACAGATVSNGAVRLGVNGAGQLILRRRPWACGISRRMVTCCSAAVF